MSVRLRVSMYSEKPPVVTQRNATQHNALNSLLVSLVPLTGNTDKKEINKSIKTLKINLKIVRFLLFIYFIWDLAMNAHSAADGH